MKKIIVPLVIFFGTILGSYHLTIYFFPNYVYSKFNSRAQSEQDRRENEFFILESPDEHSRMVVKPNPDFTYACAFYNLSDGPLSITGSLPDTTYWSVAFYQPNTLNYYVKNDIEFASTQLDLIVTRELIVEEGREQVISPTMKGFLLIRLLVVERSEVAQNKMKNYLEALKITSR